MPAQNIILVGSQKKSLLGAASVSKNGGKGYCMMSCHFFEGVIQLQTVATCYLLS